MGFTSWKVTYTYTSSSAAIASVDANGVVRAVAPGSATITVTAAGTGTGFSNASLTTAATITVADRTPSLTALQLQPASVSLTIGGTQTISAVASGPRASAATFTYTSATPAVATVSAAGVISAVAPGTATIKVIATAAESGAFAASTLEGLVTVTVSERTPGLTALQVAPSTSSLTVGGSVTITNTISGPRASAATVTYGSSAPTVATVDAAGKVSAMAPGTAVITVTASSAESGAFAASSITGLVNITVSERTAGLTGLQVSPASASVVVNGAQAITAVASGPQASAATISYGSSAPAVATVSAAGVIAGVAPGTATITVTAQSVETGAFAASSISQLIAVTVSAPSQISISLSDIKQGPSVTSYSGTGIVSGANAQVGQPIDRANVRDQIQVSAQLNPNGLPVDSVVVYVANADGSSRRAAARQTYSNGSAAAGTVTLFVNTAEFAVDFAAGTSTVSYANGQRQISVSAFSGATERQSANSETANFNNVDGYAARVTAPARSAVSAAGLTWYGGPGATGRGSATIVPVFYTAGRSLASATLAMRNGATGANTVCAATEVDAAAPFAVTFDSVAVATAADGNIECGGVESGDDNVIGVSAALDNAGNPAPITTYAAGFRTSTSVTAPSAMRIDYKAATLTAVNRTQTLPRVTGWVNATYNFNTQTDVSVDAGVGFPGTTAAAQKAGRTWQWWGCGVLSTAPNTFTGLAGDLAECATNTGSSAYSIRYTEADLLGNLATSASVTVGVDKTAPLARWSATSPMADSVGNAAATLTPEFYDALAGFADDASSPSTADTAANRATSGYVVRANDGLINATYTPGGARCYRLDGTAVTSSGNPVSAGSSFMTAPSCSSSTIGNALLGLPGTDGYRAGATINAIANAVTLASITVTDRAGNTVTISRRYFNDASAPTAAAIAAPGNIGTSNPTLSASYTDNVKVVGANVYFNYGTNLDAAGGTDNFVLPYQAQSTPFANTLNSTNSTASLTIATPAPMATSINVSGATTYTKLAQFGINAFNAFGAGTAGTDAMAATGLTTFTSLTTALSFSVGSTLSAANGAGAGLKATFNTASVSGTNSFARVDFYRRNGADNFEYLGSGSTAVQSTDLSGNQQFTWVIDSYANNPTTGRAQTAAAAGDVIIAMAVRSTGAATVSAAATIGGPALTVTFAGTDGNAGNAVITGPNGYSQTVTVSGTYAMPTGGDYTVTQYPVTTASGGRYFITGNAASTIVGTWTLVANGIPQTATVTYLSSKLDLAYTPAAGTDAWPGVPANAYVTLSNATTGFSNVFRSATTGYVLPSSTAGQPYALATTAATATSTSPIEGVSSVAYTVAVTAGNPFTPVDNANSTEAAVVTYEWSNAVKVAFTCAAGACPAGLTGTYTIGTGAAGTFTTKKLVSTTAAGTDKIHGLSGATAATTRILATSAFSTTNAAAVTAGTDRGWILDNATADSTFGLMSATVAGAASSAVNTITVNLVQARIQIDPARIGNGTGTQFQPNVTITKAGDSSCTVTLAEITSGAAASAVRNFYPSCGAGTYVITFNPSVIGGNTVSWITGAGVRIQSVVITGAAPAPAAAAEVWYN